MYLFEHKNHKRLLTISISGAVSGPSEREENTFHTTKPDVVAALNT